MVTAQAVYLAIAACLAVQAGSGKAGSFGPPALPTALMLAALVLFGSAAGLSTLLGKGGILGTLHRWLRVLPGWIGRWLDQRMEHFREMDAHLVRVLGPKAPPLGAAFTSFLVAWLAESAESFLVLALIGAPLSYAQVLPMDAAVSLLRVSAVFVPAGLGIQEAGYVSLLGAAGIGDPLHVGAAFAGIKRTREALFVAVGAALLTRGTGLETS